MGWFGRGSESLAVPVGRPGPLQDPFQPSTSNPCYRRSIRGRVHYYIQPIHPSLQRSQPFRGRLEFPLPSGSVGGQLVIHRPVSYPGFSRTPIATGDGDFQKRTKSAFRESVKIARFAAAKQAVDYRIDPTGLDIYRSNFSGLALNRPHFQKGTYSVLRPHKIRGTKRAAVDNPKVETGCGAAVPRPAIRKPPPITLPHRIVTPGIGHVSGAANKRSPVGPVPVSPAYSEDRETSIHPAIPVALVVGLVAAFFILR